MVTGDAVEGTVDPGIWFHYDKTNDVLRERVAVGEETPDGLILLRDAETDEPVGLTVVGWWKRFGEGPIPDSIRELACCIEPWARKVAA